MANGTTKPISEVVAGEYVYATDPETGESGPREVTATLPHTDQLLTLRLSSGDVVTTEDHKYWNETDEEWQDSQQLDDGDRLRSADGYEVTVEGLDWSTVHTAGAYDLTIDDLHTFYVGAGHENVLVHNCPDAGDVPVRKGPIPDEVPKQPT
ncbi:MAG: polymorphic toxin-type HINT domain-containing protein [Microthrixaceae bacterium]